MNTWPPYRPFRGAEPPHFVDRADDDLGAATIAAASLAAYRRGPCDPRFHRLVVSGAAMGKTALLRAVTRSAADHLGWVVVFHRCRPKERALRTVAAEVQSALQRKWPRRATDLAAEVLGPRLEQPWPRPHGEHPAGAGLSFADGLAPTPPSLGAEAEASWAELRRTLSLAGRFAEKQSRGVLIAFDDAHLLSRGEVESLGHLARSLSAEQSPVAMLLSGDHELGARFTRTANFSAAFWPTQLGWFDDAEAREALVVPAADRDVEFEDQAVELLCLAAAGSPLELQRLGFAAWSSARGPVVGTDDVEEAMGLAAPALAAPELAAPELAAPALAAQAS